MIRFFGDRVSRHSWGGFGAFAARGIVAGGSAADIVAPTVTASTIEDSGATDTVWRLTFSEAMDEAFVIDVGDFGFDIGFEGITLSSPTWTSSTVLELTTSRVILSGETVASSSIQAGAVEDLAGNPLAGPIGPAITNNSTRAGDVTIALDGNPSISSDGTELTIQHTVAPTLFFFDYNAFALTLASGRSVSARWLRIEGVNIVLELDKPVYASDTVTLAYTKPGTDPIADADANELASYSGQAVTNGSTIKSLSEIFDAGLVEVWDHSTLQSTGNGTNATAWNGLENGLNLTPEGTPIHRSVQSFGPKAEDGVVEFAEEGFYSDAAGLADLVSGANSGAFSFVWRGRLGAISGSQVYIGWNNTTNGAGAARVWLWTASSPFSLKLRWKDDAGQEYTYTFPGITLDRLEHQIVVGFSGGSGGTLTVDYDGVELHNAVVTSTGLSGTTTLNRFAISSAYNGTTTKDATTANSLFVREVAVGSAALTPTQRAELNAYYLASMGNPRAETYTTRYELLNTSTPNTTSNVMHPCIVRAASWHSSPDGTYLMWFGDHNGSSIKYAYSNTLTSGWTVPVSGTDWTLAALNTASGETNSTDPYITTPHVWVDDVNERYVGTACHHNTSGKNSHCAVSTDGVTWTFLNSGADLTVVQDGESNFFRPFKVGSTWYAIGNRCQLFRSNDADGTADYVQVTDVDAFRSVCTVPGSPITNTGEILHVGVFVDGTNLTLYFSRVGDTPTRLLMSTVDASGDWQSWRMTTPVELAEPLTANTFDGGDWPFLAGEGAEQFGVTREMRDPMHFVDADDSEWIVYAGAGEDSINIMQLAAAP